MALKKSLPSARKGLDFSTPFYRMTLETIGRMISQKPEVYSEIAFNNPKSAEMIGKEIIAAKRLVGIISRKDSGAYARYFDEVSDFLKSVRTKN